MNIKSFFILVYKLKKNIFINRNEPLSGTIEYMSPEVIKR